MEVDRLPRRIADRRRAHALRRRRRRRNREHRNDRARDDYDHASRDAKQSRIRDGVSFTLRPATKSAETSFCLYSWLTGTTVKLYWTATENPLPRSGQPALAPSKRTVCVPTPSGLSIT